MGRFNGVYVLPSIHLAICLIATLAYLLPPKLQFLGILWVFLNVADFPVSGATMVLALSNNGFLAGASTVVVGTLWWYLLSKGFTYLLRRVRS